MGALLPTMFSIQGLLSFWHVSRAGMTQLFMRYRNSCIDLPFTIGFSWAHIGACGDSLQRRLHQSFDSVQPKLRQFASEVDVSKWIGILLSAVFTPHCRHMVLTLLIEFRRCNLTNAGQEAVYNGEVSQEEFGR